MAKDNLKTKVYNQVLKGIIEGEYPPDQIVSESMLIEKFSVSKSPVREALVQLCGEGVLKSLPRCGYVVVKLTNEDIKDILDYRMALEGGMLRNSIEKISQAEIEILEKIDSLCTSKEALEDFWIHWKHNKEFHLKLISFSQNQFAHENLERSLNTLTRAYAQFYWNRWKSISFPSDTKFHSKIIESIKKGDMDSAVKYLEADLGDFGI